MPVDREFVRTGPLMDLKSYPQWLQQVVEECDEARHAVVGHDLFQLMRDGELSQWATRSFMMGAWPVVEQFPQYMAMNLLKVLYGRAPGHEMGRRYLIRNIRVEQNHVDYWIEWAQAHAVSTDDLFFGCRSGAAEALSHWCWHTCERDPLAAAMAATNFAIEGATGEWAALVCSSPVYESGFAPAMRKKAMKWLRVHAQYDDTHPWEALEIIAMTMGNRAASHDILGIQSGIRRSYEYIRMMLDDCLAQDRIQRKQGARRINGENQLASFAAD